ncbi:MAG TPA: ATP-dependent Clp protease adaptor ClpS [bacterium]|jgi:ATP-dependent Clp protease adaptor protein ClpS|nr:ATP-dependent Clp protease adaptor ClpS [bacterium]
MTITIAQPKEGLESRVAKPARVILYNDDWHTFDEVIGQLVKAGACDAAEAELHAWRVHTEGRSLVFHGARRDCDRVAQVLREIRLQVEVDWDD